MFSSYGNNAITVASHAQSWYQSPKYGKFFTPTEKCLCALALMANKMVIIRVITKFYYLNNIYCLIHKDNYELLPVSLMPFNHFFS